jgi:hypothetical protein
VHALGQIAGSDQVVLGDQLLDLEVEVWEGGEGVGDVLSFRLRSDDVGQVGVVADELGRQQLLGGVKVLGVSGLHPAADDGHRVVCRHARVPFATKIRSTRSIFAASVEPQQPCGWSTRLGR